MELGHRSRCRDATYIPRTSELLFLRFVLYQHVALKVATLSSSRTLCSTSDPDEGLQTTEMFNQTGRNGGRPRLLYMPTELPDRL